MSSQKGTHVSTFVFYHAPMSTSTITEAVLKELDLEVDTKLIAISKGDTRTATFRKLNPNGRVPILVHNGTPIYEASALTIYLGELYGVDKGLWPESGNVQRGLALQWVCWASVSLHEAGNRISEILPTGSIGAVESTSLDYVDPQDRSERVIQSAKSRMERTLKVLDGALESSPYLLGAEYTLVDVHVWVLVGWIESMDVDLTAYISILRWKELCLQRPTLALLFEE